MFLMKWCSLTVKYQHMESWMFRFREVDLNTVQSASQHESMWCLGIRTGFINPNINSFLLRDFPPCRETNCMFERLSSCFLALITRGWTSRLLRVGWGPMGVERKTNKRQIAEGGGNTERRCRWWSGHSHGGTRNEGPEAAAEVMWGLDV